MITRKQHHLLIPVQFLYEPHIIAIDPYARISFHFRRALEFNLAQDFTVLCGSKCNCDEETEVSSPDHPTSEVQHFPHNASNSAEGKTVPTHRHVEISVERLCRQLISIHL